MSENQTQLAALSLASAGFRVFPMHEPTFDGRGCTCNKTKCRNPGKHPRVGGGFKSASTDEPKIRSLWNRYPTANIGIATGNISNLLVIDVDSRNGGDESFDHLLVEAGELWPQTRTVVTGNGVHYWFRCPDVEIASSAGALGLGIDVRAEKGCVVAPPSLHKCGRRYEFVDADTHIVQMPDWLLNRLTRTSHAVSSPDPGSALVAVGSRNSELTSFAGGLRAQGCDWEEIYEGLRKYNETNCSEPLPNSELLDIAYSIVKYPAGKQFGPQTRSVSVGENPLWWFPFSVRQWFQSTAIALMTPEQIGWYMHLKVRAWGNRGQLPADAVIVN